MNFDQNEIDLLLLERIQSGDEHALASLMRTEFRSIYDYGMRFCNCDSTVRDAIQEVFISLWQKRSSASSIVSIRYWLLAAVKNQVLKMMRNESRISNLEDSSLEYSFTVDYSIEEKIITKQDYQERSHLLQEVLAQLSVRQKEVIYLRFYQELDAAEISALMQISAQSVYNLLHESIQRLRKCWHAGVLLRAV
ncbi:RNA polymerase sigma factor [Flavihumibacter sp. ZG627]|uniref:RNA polymerase sigma factor n=1 Tax=Flavihumibacter sp. ZG627 TaxID=1463156 RepID=UPI00057FF685|nr:sigma-70 family RNA polymerase sigma factor [Flavihumibacter sp. ZG627]KIC92109.1 hypothetical protein HY58_00640 [Flavihumibacter sp. ZG627]